MSFSELGKSLDFYRNKTTETVLPGGRRRISFPPDWHEHNGRYVGGRSVPPRFALHGLVTKEIEIAANGVSHVLVNKLFDEK